MRADAERVLFVHAHPADEAIQAGGTIAKLVAGGASVSVLTCTRGELAPVFPDSLTVIPGDLDGIAALREREARVALGALGVTDHRFLGSPAARRYGAPQRRYLDSGSRPDAHGRAVPATGLHPDALVLTDVEELAHDVHSVILGVEPTAIITDDIEAPDATPDQVHVFEAVLLAAQSSDIPVFVATRLQTAGRMLSVDIIDQLETKKLAIAAHASQCAVVGNVYRTSSGDTVEIGDREAFRLVPTSLPTAEPRWPEPGGSLTRFMLSAAGAFVAGIVVGAVTTLVHRTGIPLFGMSVPIGLILGLTAVLGLVLGLRLVSSTKIFAGLAAAGVAVSLVLLAVRGFDGNPAILDGPRGLVWSIVPLLCAFLIVSWPGSESLSRLRQRARIRVHQRLSTMGLGEKKGRRRS